LAKKKMNKKDKRVPWNKGVEVGRRAPLSAAEVTRIRKLLVKRGDSGLKHLALFSTAVDTMLRSPDLLNLKVGDVRKRNGVMRDSIALSPRGKRCNAVQCIVSKTTMSVLAKLIKDTGKKPRDYLFTGRVGGGLQPLSARQFNRIVNGWVADAGLDESAYGSESLRRTGAIAMLRRRESMEAVRDALGLQDVDHATKYLSDIPQR
jgi:integrase